MEETITWLLIGVVVVFIETIVCGIYVIHAGEDLDKKKDKHQRLPFFLEFLIMLVIAIISPANIGVLIITAMYNSVQDMSDMFFFLSVIYK